MERAANNLESASLQSTDILSVIGQYTPDLPALLSTSTATSTARNQESFLLRLMTPLFDERTLRSLLSVLTTTTTTMSRLQALRLMLIKLWQRYRRMQYPFATVVCVLTDPEDEILVVARLAHVLTQSFVAAVERAAAAAAVADGTVTDVYATVLQDDRLTWRFADADNPYENLEIVDQLSTAPRIMVQAKMGWEFLQDPERYIHDDIVDSAFTDKGLSQHHLHIARKYYKKLTSAVWQNIVEKFLLNLMESCTGNDSEWFATCALSGIVVPQIYHAQSAVFVVTDCENLADALCLLQDRVRLLWPRNLCEHAIKLTYMFDTALRKVYIKETADSVLQAVQTEWSRFQATRHSTLRTWVPNVTLLNVLN
jgi:hypothetical protein